MQIETLAKSVFCTHTALNKVFNGVICSTKLSQLSVNDWLILSELIKCDGLNGSEIANQTKMHPPSISRACKRLESLGLITGQAGEKDKRMRVFWTTRKARAFYTRTAPKIQSAFESNFNQRQVELAVKKLEKVA